MAEPGLFYGEEADQAFQRRARGPGGVGGVSSSKFLGLAVLDAPQKAASASKLLGLAVLDAPQSAASASKLLGYAVLVPAPPLGRRNRVPPPPWEEEAWFDPRSHRRRSQPAAIVAPPGRAAAPRRMGELAWLWDEAWPQWGPRFGQGGPPAHSCRPGQSADQTICFVGVGANQIDCFVGMSASEVV